jgi:hypothetical protein
MAEPIQTGNGESWNVRRLGHSDLNGFGDGMQLMLKDSHLFVGHLGKTGTSIVDVSDPRAPRVVRQLKNPRHTHTHKVQIAGNLMIINYEKHGEGEPERAGIEIFDVADPADPKPLGFFSSGGKGVHRVWYTGGDYAYMSATPEGFTDRIMLTVNVSDPTRPREVSRWWVRGMWAAGGERPVWDAGQLRYAAHHPVVWQNRAYLGFWDAGMVILDISDPASPREISRTTWNPKIGGHTHTCLPLPRRHLLVLTEEATDDERQEIRRRVRVMDIADETRPREIGLFPEPAGDFCKRGHRFGPHNVHENRPGSFIGDRTIYTTYFNAGLRIYDLSRPESPEEIAYYIPQTPEGQKAAQTNDVFVAENGLIYISDRINGGVDILELTV